MSDDDYNVNELDDYLLEMATGKRRNHYLVFSTWVAREAYNTITSLQRQVNMYREENRLLREKMEGKP